MRKTNALSLQLSLMHQKSGSAGVTEAINVISRGNQPSLLADDSSPCSFSGYFDNYIAE